MAGDGEAVAFGDDADDVGSRRGSAHEVGGCVEGNAVDGLEVPVGADDDGGDDEHEERERHVRTAPMLTHGEDHDGEEEDGEGAGDGEELDFIF